MIEPGEQGVDVRGRQFLEGLAAQHAYHPLRVPAAVEFGHFVAGLIPGHQTVQQCAVHACNRHRCLGRAGVLTRLELRQRVARLVGASNDMAAESGIGRRKRYFSCL